MSCLEAWSLNFLALESIGAWVMQCDAVPVALPIGKLCRILGSGGMYRWTIWQSAFLLRALLYIMQRRIFYVLQLDIETYS